MRTRLGQLACLLVAGAFIFGLAVPLYAAEQGKPPDFKGQWFSANSVIVALGLHDGGTKPRLHKNGDGPDRDLAIVGNNVLVSGTFVSDRIVVIDIRYHKEDKDNPKNARNRIIQEFPFPGGTSDLVTADFNADGKGDFAAAAFLDDQVQVFLGKGDGTFTRKQVIKVGKEPFEMLAADFNGDKIVDIATANLQKSVSTAFGQKGGTFKPAKTEKVTGALAASSVFAMNAPAGVDFTPLKTALQNAKMSDRPKARLTRNVNKSEQAYNRGNSRHAVDCLESFIKYLRKLNDSKLSDATRRNLLQLARDLINQILGGGKVSVTMTADPWIVTAGGTSTLTWSSNGATSAEIDNGVGSVTVNGSTPVNPGSTTTYTITATDGVNSGTATATVTVVGASETIYVDANRGSDVTGTGAPDNPFKTITKGLSVAPGGKTVSVAAGTYDADLGEVFPLIVPMGVRVVGAGTSRTLIMGGGTFNSPSNGPMPVAVVLNHLSVLDPLKVVNPTTNGIGVWAEDGTATIENCKVTGCDGPGVIVAGSGNLVLTGCTLYENGSTGLVVWDNATINLTGNTFRDNGGDGVFITSGAPNTVDSQTFVNDDAATIFTLGAGVSFTNNTFTDNAGSGWGIVSGLFTNTTITGNTITGDYYNGIYSFYIDYSTISNNTIHGSDSGTNRGVYLYFLSIANVSNNTISNTFRGVYGYYYNYATVTGNTIHDCARGVRAEIDGAAGFAGTQFTNNQINGCDQGFQVRNCYTAFTNNTITNCNIGIYTFYYEFSYFGNNTITGCDDGIRNGYYSDNYFGANTITGSTITGATVDYYNYGYPWGDPVYGPPAGGNVFHNLTTGQANFRNYAPITVNALGNTWDNAPPTVDGTGAFPGGNDIEWDGGIGGNVLY